MTIEEIKGLLKNISSWPWQYTDGHHVVYIWANYKDGEVRELAVPQNDYDLPFIAASPQIISELLGRLKVAENALRLITEYGGKSVETEVGNLTCQGRWCADQAAIALEELK